jgi:hypothetical protein
MSKFTVASHETRDPSAVGGVAVRQGNLFQQVQADQHYGNEVCRSGGLVFTLEVAPPSIRMLTNGRAGDVEI